MTQGQQSEPAGHPADIAAVQALYHQLLESWNKRSAEEFASLFDDDGYVIGFDGSPMQRPVEIATELGSIFADHATAAYVGKPKLVRLLTPDVAVLRAVAGMVPPERTDINPAVNAMQTLVATRRDGRWRIAVYQNTPAQFHGRPELSQALTEELRELL